MDTPNEKYIHALRWNFLTKLYDPLLRATIRERAFKNALIKQAAVQDGHRVLDLACGTATLTIWLKERYANAEIAGIDGDPKILDIAREKIERAGVAIELHHGMSYELPFPDNHFDRVVSSLFFHHLTTENKLKTGREILRVLKPGGELHVVDWGKPGNVLMATAFFFVRLFDGFAITADNAYGRLPALFEEAGLEDAHVRTEIATVGGTVTTYSARKPGG